jgi:poly-gamma-glutamate synthesis protein (capsule biosynthesis protein)
MKNNNPNIKFPVFLSVFFAAVIISAMISGLFYMSGRMRNILGYDTVFPVPDLSSIFGSNRKWISGLDQGRLKILIATGDVIPARSVNREASLRNNFRWPFENTVSFLSSADITLINLEASLIAGCPVVSTGMVFCGSQRNIEGLTYAGIDVANLANNHTRNYGEAGLAATERLLAANNIKYSGTGDITFLESKGSRFAFLGYNDLEGDHPAADQLVIRQVKEAKSMANIVVVSFHWGVEYVRQPTERQIQLAHTAVDAGADLVIGNHPHWIQPIEFYRGKLIAYAHGNFIFDQMWSEETRTGMVGKYTFYDDRLVDAEFFPVKIRDYGQPYLLEGTEKDRVMETIKKASFDLSAKISSGL